MLKLNVGIIELIAVLITWGPLLLIGALVLFLIYRSKKSRDRMKKCDSCANMVPANARFCQFCGKELAQ